MHNKNGQIIPFRYCIRIIVVLYTHTYNTHAMMRQQTTSSVTGRQIRFWKKEKKIQNYFMLSIINLHTSALFSIYSTLAKISIGEI